MTVKKTPDTAIPLINITQFEEMIRQQVEAAIKTLLVDQLDNVIVGELAKLRLMGKGGPTLSQRIEHKVELALRCEVSAVDFERLVNNRVSAEIDKTLRPHIKTVAGDVEQRMRARIKAQVLGLIQ